MFFLLGLDNQGEKQNLKVKTRDNKWYSQLSPMAKEHLKKGLPTKKTKMQLQVVVKVKRQAKNVQQTTLRVLTTAFLHL
jgi:hypothetical protein